MKVNELMIDDWVTCSLNGKYYKVSSLTSDVTLEGDKFIFNCLCDYIEPIPLTAEILKKNGFEKVNGEYQDVFYCCDGLDLLIDDHLEPCGYTLYGVFELQIKYLHELQHALRLGGINKEIEL